MSENTTPEKQVEETSSDLGDIFKDEIPVANDFKVKNEDSSVGVGSGENKESFAEVAVETRKAVEPNVSQQLAEMQNMISELKVLQQESANLKASEPKTPRGHDLEKNTGGQVLIQDKKQSKSENLLESSYQPAYVGGSPDGIAEGIRKFIEELGGYKKKAISLSKEMTRDIDAKRQDAANAENFQWVADRLETILKG